ncbi:MAG TPA: hypothetical protein VFT57_01945 [Gemmatimonadaceae bacterium]|jgi:hypothetical protein|nr:hypothetical protein [Gemmatimonadaceae bacterium]
MMKMRTSKSRAAAAASALLAAFVLLAGSAAVSTASAQATRTDARWQPWLGCWEPVGALDAANGRMLCVLPVEGSPAVELATVDSGKVLVRERVVANGERMNSDQGGCKGWKSAQWSPDGQQLYLHSDFDCEGGLKRTSTGIFAMAPGGIWLDVQGVSAKDGGGVRVIRYRSAGAPDVLRDELARVTAERELALSTARTASAGSVSLQDVIDASRAVDPAVVQAWLIERRQNFAVDSKQLEQLAAADVPASVIDAMVALSYPKQFAIAGMDDIGLRSGEVALETDEQPSGRTIISTMMYPYGFGYYGLSPFDYLYSPYGYTPYGYGYGFGFGWYPSGVPVVIIRNPDVNAAHGRVVNGRGYVRGGSGNDGNARGSIPRRSRSDGSSTSTGSSSRGGTSVAPSSGSSGQSTGRTAKPRKP